MRCLGHECMKTDRKKHIQKIFIATHGYTQGGIFFEKSYFYCVWVDETG